MIVKRAMKSFIEIGYYILSLVPLASLHNPIYAKYFVHRLLREVLLFTKL